MPIQSVWLVGLSNAQDLSGSESSQPFTSIYKDGDNPGSSSQGWMTFVRNHAEGILACDFFITVTASFRVL